MSINNKKILDVVPMPSRIEITFNSFIPNTRIPNVDYPKIRFYYQDYDIKTFNVYKSNIMEFDSENIQTEDFKKCMDIFVKIFEDKYRMDNSIV